MTKAKERMTDQEILQKAIEKAESNGYVLENSYWQDETIAWWIAAPSIIFSHNFAKAFWGSKCPDEVCPTGDGDRPHEWVWQQHLQQMVLEENPVKYLEKYL